MFSSQDPVKSNTPAVEARARHMVALVFSGGVGERVRGAKIHESSSGLPVTLIQAAAAS